MSKKTELQAQLKLAEKNLNNPAIKDNPTLRGSLEKRMEKIKSEISDLDKKEKKSAPVKSAKSNPLKSKKAPGVPAKTIKKAQSTKSSPGSSISKLNYDCDTLIEKEIEKAKKRKLAAKKNANQPAKTPATKTKEVIVKASEKIETDIHKRLAKGQVKPAEIDKLITQTKKLLAALVNAQKQAKKSPSNKKDTGGSVSNTDAERKKLRDAFFKKKGEKKERGGSIDIPGTEKLKKLGIKDMREFGNKYRSFLNKIIDKRNGKYIGYQLHLAKNNLVVIQESGTHTISIYDYDSFPEKDSWAAISDKSIYRSSGGTVYE